MILSHYSRKTPIMITVTLRTFNLFFMGNPVIIIFSLL